MIPFIKMHGAGNDFVIIDARKHALSLSNEDIMAVSNRYKGVGCDQLIAMKASAKADVYMQIFNADGSESASCGNATRCVASLLMDETRQPNVTIETKAGILSATQADNGEVVVDMGMAKLAWQDIPLATSRDTLHLGIGREGLQDPVGVSMGNPHAVFFVTDVDAVDLARLGSMLEHDPLFPERANIGVAQVLSSSEIRLRVWERGSGETLACGSGACAAVVAACRRKLIQGKTKVLLPGGTLTIEWLPDGRVMMQGPVATSFTGILNRGHLYKL